jgi:hypothetical protein
MFEWLRVVALYTLVGFMVSYPFVMAGYVLGYYHASQEALHSFTPPQNWPVLLSDSESIVFSDNTFELSTTR